MILKNSGNRRRQISITGGDIGSKNTYQLSRAQVMINRVGGIEKTEWSTIKVMSKSPSPIL